MAITLFKDTTYSLSTLIDEIRRGEIALPDIQRPFVWKAARVRDLFDSMYRGFPVGSLLFWATGAEVGARQIGVAAKEAAPRLLIVDGQQRLTSLYAVLTGTNVVTHDYKEARIRLAFSPRDAQFKVTDAAVARDPEFIPDISVLWSGPGRRHAVRQFLRQLESAKGELTEPVRDDLEEAIDRLYDIRNYPFKVVELGPEVEEEQVADVFVRINSEGVKLQQADFILTLMSVWWEDGRRALEEFARAARVGPQGGSSPANPFIDPSADQLLRVAAGLAFRRGRLKYVYQVLRGKDLQTGEISAEVRERQFAALRDAQECVLDLTNWHEFLKAVRRAGYRSRSMLTSNNNLLFSYLVYLVGRRSYDLDRRSLREAVARWFFMTSLTSRYTGNFESQVEADLRRLSDCSEGQEFIDRLDALIDLELTSDFWHIRVPALLEKSGGYSPALFAYQASLVLLGASPLFSSLTIGELSEATARGRRAAIERHHLFPAGWLEKQGVTKPSRRNQIANYAWLEWPDNSSIGSRAPVDYFPPLFTGLSPRDRANARFWHALPEGWEEMEYPAFLRARRMLISKVIEAATRRLRTGELPDELSPAPSPAETRSLAELIAEMETATVEFKSSLWHSYREGVPEKVITTSVVKTVAGLMNGGGGTLVIGVDDDGNILGIEKDLLLKKMDTDRYVNALTTLLGTALGQGSSTLAHVRVERARDGSVCLVDVDPSVEPVFARVSKSERVFFVRVNNSTRRLDGAEMLKYVRQRWP